MTYQRVHIRKSKKGKQFLAGHKVVFKSKRKKLICNMCNERLDPNNFEKDDEIVCWSAAGKHELVDDVSMGEIESDLTCSNCGKKVSWADKDVIGEEIACWAGFHPSFEEGDLEYADVIESDEDDDEDEDD